LGTKYFKNYMIEVQGLLKDFKGKDFKDFAAYVYVTMQKEIDSKKKKQDKDKYIKIRQSILKYIIANERAISVELNKKK
jgi:hypothetical protein